MKKIMHNIAAFILFPALPYDKEMETGTMFLPEDDVPAGAVMDADANAAYIALMETDQIRRGCIG